jgi:hypothetical protein
MRKLDKNPIYYVYEHYKPNCDEPFWVGKGKGNRAHVSGKGCGRNKHWHHIANKYGFEVRFVAENLNETESLWLENMCIKGWGRADLGEGPLANATDGADGGAGRIWTKEDRQDKGDAMRGNRNALGHSYIPTPDCNQANRERMMGNIHWIGDENTNKLKSKNAMGNTYALGCTHSEEANLAQREYMLERNKDPNYIHPRLGKKHSEKTKRENSESHMGNTSALGCKHSKEAKEAESERMKLWWKVRYEYANRHNITGNNIRKITVEMLASEPFNKTPLETPSVSNSTK